MPSEREVHGDRVRMRRAVLRASVARSEARRPVLYSELSQGDIHPRVRRDEEIPPLFLAELFRGGVQSYGVKVATLGIAMAIAASPQVGCGLREVVDEPPNEPAVEDRKSVV